MRFEGVTMIKAPREKVWAFLTDPKAVGSCAPGLESLEVAEPGKRFRAMGSVGFGAVQARLTADVEWIELDRPNRAGMKLHGTAPGSAVDATTSMTLSESDSGSTELAWTADVSVAGTIASLAARLMGGVVRKLTGQFFTAVKKKIETRNPGGRIDSRI